MDLDIRTLAFVATFSSVLMALSLGALWWVNRTEKSTVYWLAGAIMMALGFLLIGFRHLIDPFLSIVVANIAILCGYACHYAGIQTFVGKPINAKPLTALIVAVLMGFIYYTYFDKSVSARIIIISWGVAIVTAAATTSLAIQVRKRFSVPELFVAFFLFLYTVFMAGRGVFTLFEAGTVDFLKVGTVHAFAFILIMLLSITLSIGYSVMITGRLNLELKSKNTELEFQKRALDEHAIVSITNTEERLVYVNDKYCEVSGYARDDLIGQKPEILRSGYHPPEFFAEIWATLNDRETWHGEMKNRSRSGQLYWVSATIYPLLDEQGTPQSYVFLGTDITHRKELELALSQAQSIARIGSWTWDYIKSHSMWSEELYRILGIAKGEVEPGVETYGARIHPDDYDRVQHADLKAIEEQAPYDLEYRIVALNSGETRWVHERRHYERSIDGKVLRFVSTVHDITTRKEAERSLEATKTRLEKILENASDGIHILDRYGNVVEFNRSFARMLGYSVTETAGLNVADWDAVIPEDALVDTIKDLINNPATFETKHRRKDGSLYDAEISATGVAFEGNIYLYASCRDITDRKNAENEIRQRTEDLELANSTLERQAQEMVVIAEQLSQAKEVAEKLAVTDRLTGLFNRLKLDQAFTAEYERCRRYGHPLSIVIFDLDHFKSVNDTFGHQVGDTVLIAVADILRQCVRTVDIAGRWGGEEFLVISPDTDVHGAEQLAEKIRAAIEAYDFPTVGHKTASFGVAEFAEGDSIDTLTTRADSALYHAKETGRNRVTVK